MYKVGITGGIGSGKSTVCTFFKLMGIPIFSADDEAKKIMNESALIRSKMILQFGKDIYLPDHTIDRKKLAAIIFNSPSLLQKVNSIIHPEVQNYFFEWCKRQQSPYIIHEAAILFESGFYEMMDFTLLVTALQYERIKWVASRDNSTAEQVEERMSKQWTDEEKEKLADLSIVNNNRELMLPQLIELDKKFRTHG